MIIFICSRELCGTLSCGLKGVGHLSKIQRMLFFYSDIIENILNLKNKHILGSSGALFSGEFLEYF